ncbi:alcohol oxidase [Aureobasidium pullulans]|uniref:Alcohol oxidase n=1 Tax=Aureobasidium pullulans TaxID=5580 RepID=A0A4S9X2D9_AURPU|nr:alcohol oxidase [Aureobasidium pullulans]THZ71924.1 alcohol oxidase [Aureobasidium pullulans]THZ96911.1 alcohol oxidase [Aureobasidium pullulans]
MFFTRQFLFALVAGVRSGLADSASTYYGTPFDVGNGDSFGIPGNASFDYVVVGGGAAGLAVAMRLAEDNTHTVAVVEAGGFYQLEAGNKSVTPAYNSEFASIDNPLSDPLIDWGFVTTPQPGANNRTLHYARGKTLGGSSALNANVYNRGTVASYQEWADLVGDDSYTFDQWLPYFAKGVNYTVPNGIRAANATVPQPSSDAIDFSPTGGPLRVSHSNFALPFSSWAQKAFQYFGFANITTFSNGQLLGSQYAPQALNPISNERETSATSYLDAALNSNRTNLKVYTHSLALQVLFSENKTATGVLVRSGRLDYVLTARKEVVLSAGAFQSPQLLMVSGIGPAAQLQHHNISVVADRPGVGQNMWDHVDMEVTYKVDVVGFNTLKNETYNQEQLDGFHTVPAVSMYGSYGADYIGWEKLPANYRANMTSTARDQLATFPSDWPEIEYEVASIYESTDPEDFHGYGTFVVIPVSPLSRGSVSLQSNSMLDPPIIDPQWLTNPADVELAIQALKRAREILASPALAPIRLGGEVAPGESVVTDAQILEYIRNTFFMNWHAAATCKMGRTNDTMAVVDSKARVIGVQNLRVVDASAFALLPPGHPISTVYGLAEKISADIVANR